MAKKMNRGTDKIWEMIKGEQVMLVAEIGKNFIQTKKEQSRSEYLQRAKQLVDKAIDAGADAVKFQAHHYQDEQWPAKVVSPHFNGADRYAWVKRNSLITTEEWWRSLKKYCDKRGTIFFAAPMSRGAAKMLQKVGVKLWKVGSGDILDFVMLDYLRSHPQPIIISTGMSSIMEVDLAVKFIRAKNKKLAILHCVSKYPCPVEELNVNTVAWLQKRYKLPVGFSDHSIGYEGVIQAVKVGAKIIEKHFSLNRNLWGADHQVSMTPGEFEEMARTVRRGVAGIVENKKILGRIKPDLADRDSQFRGIFRKSLVSLRNIKKGQMIKREWMAAMRPQAYIKGIGSERYADVVGQQARREIMKMEPLTEEDAKKQKVGRAKRKASDGNYKGRENAKAQRRKNRLGSVLGIIPARGGSKGIKDKNIARLQGQPLIAFSIKAVQGARHQFDWLVSTDDQKIRKVAEAWGGLVPYLRPKHLAKDKTNIIDVIEDILKRTDKKYDYILLLQPTAPLRRSQDIDAALDLAAASGADSVCSFMKVESLHPWYMYYWTRNNRIKQVVPTKAGKPRQQFPPALWRNGAIYLVKTRYLLKNRNFISADCRPYIMPEERSVNIDTVDDFKLAEYYLKRSKNKE